MDHIGHGSFGKVFRAKRIDGGEIFAIKVIYFAIIKYMSKERIPRNQAKLIDYWRQEN